MDARVPTLVLQPLVENAVRHGLERRAGSGKLTIVATRTGPTLHLVVTDNGHGLATSARGGIAEGLGLSNTRPRLMRPYGPAARLTLAEPAAGGCEVQITLPYRPHQKHDYSYDHRRRSAAGA